MDKEIEDTGTKYLTWKVFRKFNKEGWVTIYKEGKELISMNNRDTNSEEVSDDKQTTNLVHGFVKFSRLCAATLLWIPSFIFDIRLGLYTSKWFVYCSYFTAMISTLIGCAIANLLFASTFRTTLPGIGKQVSSFLTFIAQVAMNLYVFYSCATLAYIVFHRKYLNDFILYKCSNIQSPKKHQTKTLVLIFFSCYTCGILAEPLFVFLTMKVEFIQPILLPNISSNIFFIVKWICTVVIVIAAATLSILQSIVPMMTSFLICMCESHIDLLATKLTSRLYKFEGKRRSNLENVRLTSLIDDNSRRITLDHSVSTLCDDWADFDEIKVDGDDNDGDSNSGDEEDADNDYDYNIPKRGDHLSKCLAIGSRIFLFRNLIKNLIELKDIIAEYSQVFGALHLIFVCLGGLLVAQWTVVGVVQSGLLLKNVDSNDKLNYANPIYTRTACSAIVFMTTNTITFIRCDRLPSRLQKLRSQMFKINLDLVDLCGEKRDDSKSTWQELQLAWSLYDQFCITSHEVNFKLTGTTNYSKHCLLLIFGREISLILFYLQLIDIYSTV